MKFITTLALFVALPVAIFSVGTCVQAPPKDKPSGRFTVETLEDAMSIRIVTDTKHGRSYIVNRDGGIMEIRESGPIILK